VIRHCVFLRLRAGAKPAELSRIFEGLAALTSDLSGASDFVGGQNIDVENKTPDFPAGFTIDFTDRAALMAYANSPDHRALGARLVALCDGGGDGISVFDLLVEP